MMIKTQIFLANIGQRQNWFRFRQIFLSLKIQIAYVVTDSGASGIDVNINE
jgi:hypothetical protein